MINFMKYKFFYFGISFLLIGLSIYGLSQWGLKLGLDFTGGSIFEYKFEEDISTEDAIAVLEEKEIQISSVQSTGENAYLFKTTSLSEDEKQILDTSLKELYGQNTIQLRSETVGPSIGPELVKKTIYAIIIAATAILFWVAFQFKSFKFGASAVLAMFHDSFILIGFFAWLGYFYGAEIDFLFATALLTTLSFSVHDTIVVYDRIRESQRKVGGDLVELSNKAIAETMVRSLNNSFTIIFMLFALILMGGTTIKWFAGALFIGTVLGTYSSPFVAVPLLVTLDSIIGKIKK